MNKEFPQPLYLRVRHIHDLERAADDQRERLRLHTAELVAEVRGGGLWRGLAGSVLTKATAQAGPLGGIIRNLVMRLGNHSHRNGKKKFPWVSAVLAGVAATGFVSWWKQRRDEETADN